MIPTGTYHFRSLREDLKRCNAVTILIVTAIILSITILALWANGNIEF